MLENEAMLPAFFIIITVVIAHVYSRSMTLVYTAFLRGLVGQILPPDLPDLFLRPCRTRHNDWSQNVGWLGRIIKVCGLGVGMTHAIIVPMSAEIFQYPQLLFFCKTCTYRWLIIVDSCGVTYHCWLKIHQLYRKSSADDTPTIQEEYCRWYTDYTGRVLPMIHRLYRKSSADDTPTIQEE